MKIKKRVINLIQLITILISMISIGLRTLPSEKDTAYAVGCAVWDLPQSNTSENIYGECQIYKYGDWYFDWYLISCIYSPGDSCKAVTCTIHPNCRELIPD